MFEDFHQNITSKIKPLISEEHMLKHGERGDCPGTLSKKLKKYIFWIDFPNPIFEYPLSQHYSMHFMFSNLYQV